MPDLATLRSLLCKILVIASPLTHVSSAGSPVLLQSVNTERGIFGHILLSMKGKWAKMSQL